MPWTVKQGRKKDRLNPKPVVQYDLEGNYIRDWPSARAACESLGINIGFNSNGQPKAPNVITSACARPNSGEFGSPIPCAAFGFRWSYKETI